MELISTSKMRRASEATLASRPYTQRIWQILHNITNNTEASIHHPLLDVRPTNKVLLICIASEKGLAGSYNANVAKEVISYIQENKDKEVEIIVIGKKIAPILKNFGANIIQVYPHFSSHPTTKDTKPILDFAMNYFYEQKYDQVLTIYTEFFSVMKQEVLTRQILPLNLANSELSKMQEEKGVYKVQKEKLNTEFKYEPNPTTVLDSLLPRFAETLLYQAVIESMASEHCARRIAMKNATDNAISMLDDLSLTYNGLRQSAITNELAEITSGAAAL